MTIVKIENHTRSRMGYKLNHIAEVTTDAPVTTADHAEFVNEVSMKAGYHPMGYGIYGSKSVTELEPNKYLVAWTTGASCD